VSLFGENNMKLQEFVGETLKEVIAGIKNAQEYAAEHEARVNPPSRYINDNRQFIHIIDDSTAEILLKDVEFDIAVTSSEGSEAKGSAGISVVGISLGAQAKTDTSSSSISRIKFSIPHALPIQHKTKQ
jgi:hypothetical protein